MATIEPTPLLLGNEINKLINIHQNQGNNNKENFESIIAGTISWIDKWSLATAKQIQIRSKVVVKITRAAEE